MNFEIQVLFLDQLRMFENEIILQFAVFANIVLIKCTSVNYLTVPPFILKSILDADGLSAQENVKTVHIMTWNAESSRRVDKRLKIRKFLKFLHSIMH